jgi:hypothetical protein
MYEENIAQDAWISPVRWRESRWMWRVMRQVRQVMRQVRRAIDVWVACRYFCGWLADIFWPAHAQHCSQQRCRQDLAARPLWT